MDRRSGGASRSRKNLNYRASVSHSERVPPFHEGQGASNAAPAAADRQSGLHRRRLSDRGGRLRRRDPINMARRPSTSGAQSSRQNGRIASSVTVRVGIVTGREDKAGHPTRKPTAPFRGDICMHAMRRSENAIVFADHGIGPRRRSGRIRDINQGRRRGEIRQRSPLRKGFCQGGGISPRTGRRIVIHRPQGNKKRGCDDGKRAAPFFNSRNHKCISLPTTTFLKKTVNASFCSIGTSDLRDMRRCQPG
jgi:hypothetical protein